MKLSHARSLPFSNGLSTRLSTRLALGFGLVLALLLSITALALERMQAMQVHTREIVEVGQQRLLQTQAMMNASNDAAVALFGFMLTSDEIDVKAQQELYDGAIKRYGAAEKAWQALLGQADPATTTQQKKLGDAASAALSFAHNISSMASAGGDLGAAFRSMDPRRVLSDWRQEIEVLVTLQRKSGEQTYEDAKSSFARARFLLALVAGLACVVGAAASWLILRSVTAPLRQAVAHAQRIATGDLSKGIEAHGDDEMGELLKALSRMQERLHAMVSVIRTCSEGMGTASSEIAQGNLDLSQRTEQTAGRLEQTASSMEQLTAAVQQTAGTAQTAKQLADSASVTAIEGGKVVGAVVTTMNAINASSKRIGDITGVIDAIAFQTNILALNAAVEAARAGEQGRGFAVVASEVRSLAQRSAAAAREIKDLIGASVGQVDEGSRLVQDAGSTMSEIVDSVHRVTDMIGAITAAAGEQSAGLAQVNGAVHELDQMTQQNAALVEESAAAAESLNQQAQRLAEAVQGFRIVASS